MMEIRVESFCCVFGFSFAFWALCQGETLCDPDFKASVESCLLRLDGFPAFTQELTFDPGDWDKTSVICKWGLAETASMCVTAVYAMCPHTTAYRSLCGFQTLDPALLSAYGKAVCRHMDVLQTHSWCFNSSLCSLKSCLRSYNPFVPSRLSTGLWKSPQFPSVCNYYAHAQVCHEKSQAADECSTALYTAHLDILNATRPSSCPEKLLDELTTRFRQAYAHSDVVFNGAPDWLHRRTATQMLTATLLVAVGRYLSAGVC